MAPRTAQLFTWPLLALAFLLAALASVGAASASAAPEILWDRCQLGTGAAQCKIPRGVAADSEGGHVFIADSENNRVVELNALGEFIKAWGWGVDSGAEELEACTAASGCQVGNAGSGEGQFGFFSPQGVAVDSEGFVYVLDRGLPSNARIQKFDREGDFVMMFGGDVNKTKVEEAAPEAERNVCPVEPGDECQKGTQGTGQGQFGNWPATGDRIAIDPEDNVYVGDVGRIQLFDTAGEYQDECSTEGNTVYALDIDSSGDLYAIYGNTSGQIHKLGPPPGCAEQEVGFELEDPDGNPVGAKAVAVDPAGDVYAFGPTKYSAGKLMDPVFRFGSSGGEAKETFGRGEFDDSTGLATNLCPGSESPGNLYVSNSSSANAFVRAYGTGPFGCFKARTLPASNVEETTATLNGTVNPDGGPVSECRFEYGTSEEYGSEAPCAESPAEIGEGTEPVPVHADIVGLSPGTIYHFRLRATVGGEAETGADETFKTEGPPVISDEHTASVTATEATVGALVNPEGFPTSYTIEYGTTEALGSSTEAFEVGADRSDRPVARTLEDLEPDTTYYWQLVATNSSDSSEGELLSFITYRTLAGPEIGCPNDTLRSGPSAGLPDCRAYEMVSPVDKNGGDILSLRKTNQARPDGEKIAYHASACFSGTSCFSTNQYLAERGTDGWSSEGIHPPVTGEPVGPIQFGAFRSFIAFTPDLCDAWLADYQAPPPSADGQVGFRNLYRRHGCTPGVGELEALTPNPPALPEGAPQQYVDSDSVQGVSDDGRHTVFIARTPLPHAPEAAATAATQVYDRFDSAVKVVSILPNGTAATAGAAVGSGWNHNLDNAVSADGSRVYWTSGVDLQGRGELYLRLHPEQGKVAGECEGEAACTIAVSGSQLFQDFFWGASPDGSRALFSETTLEGGEDLYEFDLARLQAEEAPLRLVAEDILASTQAASGMLGASEDFSRVYFASREALPGTGGVEGEPNIYLAEGEEVELVATVAEGDVEGIEPGALQEAYLLASGDPTVRPVRVSPDGSHLAFQSRAQLTEFDNTGAAGRAAVEVYLFDAEAGAEADPLTCISCNPSGARPQTRELRQLPGWTGEARPTGVFAAAWIPTWERSLHASNALSEDGDRLFFNSNDALVPHDRNGQMDVYEWETPGTGSCTDAADNPAYFPQNGGCLYLISDAQSDFESEFVAASRDGEDVFFTTESKLLEQDPGLVDLYDARVNGGYPTPERKSECEGEACQSPPPPPSLDEPSSFSFEGAGNLPPQGRDCTARARRAAGLSRRARRTRRAARRMARRSNPRAARKTARKSRRLARKAKRLSKNAKRCRRANRRAER